MYVRSVVYASQIITNLCFDLFLGPEYGTMEAAWKGILTEAERLADVHLKVKENLCAGEVQQIKTWQKDNYHKVSAFREPSIIFIVINVSFSS